jgi:hypothetical protein
MEPIELLPLTRGRKPRLESPRHSPKPSVGVGVGEAHVPGVDATEELDLKQLGRSDDRARVAFEQVICPPVGPALWESGGTGVVVGVKLCEHAEAAVPPGVVVEHFDPVEDLRRQFGPSAPLSGVEQLGLHPTPERLDRRVVERVTDRAQGVGEPRAADPLTVA